MSPASLTLDALRRSPNALAADYTRFRVGERVLLTGHSHQAWPDVAREAQLAAWDQAAEHVDEKWPGAFERADRVREGFGALLGVPAGEIALGQNTHELVTRLLSALPFETRPRLISTDGEFHTLRRQLDRLAECGWCEVMKIAARPAETLAARLAAALDDRTAAVLVSSVLFETAEIVPGLGDLFAACARRGAELLVDAYHQLGVVPCALPADGLDGAFVTGGGYKYLQLGEGNCFLRVPPESERHRPILTGWFSEFGRLSRKTAGGVPYGAGAARWAGSTYDPTSHHRAARVFEFFAERGLAPTLLRQVSQHQVGTLAARFDALDLDPALVTRDREVPLERVGGFLALRTSRAEELSLAMRAADVWTDYRGDRLRLGPAPYLSDAQLGIAMTALGEAARKMARR
ncbi:MAG: kynureninase [Candidatus Eisenbacteria bacterium]